MNETKTYNGWSNYETWRIMLEIVDEYWYNGDNEELKKYSTSELADHLKELVDDLITQSGEGLTVDYALAFANNANYYEMAGHLLDSNN